MVPVVRHSSSFNMGKTYTVRLMLCLGLLAVVSFQLSASSLHKAPVAVLLFFDEGKATKSSAVVTLRGVTPETPLATTAANATLNTPETLPQSPPVKPASSSPKTTTNATRTAAAAAAPPTVTTATEPKMVTSQETPTATLDTSIPETRPEPIIIKWDGVSSINQLLGKFWKGNLFCDTVRGKRGHDDGDTTTPLQLQLQVKCGVIFRRSNLGTGNVLLGLYGLRLSARVLGNIDITMQCSDAVEQQTNLILPWLMGTFPGGAAMTVADIDSQTDAASDSEYAIAIPNRNVTLPPIEDACGNFQKVPLAYMLPTIRYELRRMAIALVGVHPDQNHPSTSFAERFLWNNDTTSTFATKNAMQLKVPGRDEPPLIPNVELDDTVVHFRCGDLMDTGHPGYGFMKYSAFSKRISNATTSIGISTQPFSKDDGSQNRKMDADSNTGDQCRMAVESLVEHLHERFPKARITVHNGPTETIALAYARMVMANETYAGVGTFGVFPVMATFGTGYIRFPKEGATPNGWLKREPRIDTLFDDVVLMQEPNRLTGKVATQMRKDANGMDLVLKWFNDDTYCYDGPCK